jgi:branched-chain amino acid transport system permease protein
VKAGEILALIGPNGAGKSTMFNQLSGVDTPTSGEVLFRGKPVAGRDSREIARLGMSRTFQHVRLLPKMSVLENVAIGAHLRGSKRRVPAAWRLDRAEEARSEEGPRSSASAWRPHARRGRQPGPGPAAHPRDRPRPVRRPCLLLLDEPAAGLRLKRQASASCCASCAPKAWRSCSSSTTWTS